MDATEAARGPIEIDITDIPGFDIGHATDEKGGTGCTAIVARRGMAAGIDMRGGGPASRETGLLRPASACQSIHALLLSGGSAYGLDAAGGVMRYLEERGIGFPVAGAVVPLVVASCLFDLNYREPRARPDARMGYAACLDAEKRRGDSGAIGAGTGATVGKLGGPARMMKSGLGCYAVRLGALKIGAVAAVNALGDVFDFETGEKLAGFLSEDRTRFCDSEAALLGMAGAPPFPANTTLAAVLTNAAFDKTRLTKLAAMAQNGLARAIRPVHTSADGDTVYALSAGNEKADPDIAGTLAARVVAAAIRRAVLSAQPSPDLPVRF